MICYYSILVILHEMGEASFNLISTNAFQVRAEDERFSAEGSLPKLQIWKFHIIVWQTKSKK